MQRTVLIWRESGESKVRKLTFVHCRTVKPRMKGNVIERPAVWTLVRRRIYRRPAVRTVLCLIHLASLPFLSESPDTFQNEIPVEFHHQDIVQR